MGQYTERERKIDKEKLNIELQREIDRNNIKEKRETKSERTDKAKKKNTQVPMLNILIQLEKKRPSFFFKHLI